MSDAAPKAKRGRASARGLRFAIVVADFNARFTLRLLKSARQRLRALGAAESSLKTYHVPGAFELGFAAKEPATTGFFDAVICLGTVIRGETSHYNLVCKAASEGILQAGLQSGLPCIFGVITCDNEVQAAERCSGGPKDAGSHAAEAAVTMARLSRSLRHGR
jgi:6,7-dimethyl-8-ribityllumazine synthase